MLALRELLDTRREGKSKLVRNVRCSPNLTPRAYVVCCKSSSGCVSLTFMDSAINDIQGVQTATPFFFWEFKEDDIPDASHPGCAVDEVQKLIYVLGGPGQSGVFLKTFHLSFRTHAGSPASTVLAYEGPGYKIKLDQVLPKAIVQKTFLLPFHSLAISNKTGNLITHCVLRESSKGNASGRGGSFPAIIHFKKNNKSALLKPLIDVRYLHFLLDAYESKVMGLTTPLLPSDGRTVISWHGYNNKFANNPEAHQRVGTIQDGFILLKSYALDNKTAATEGNRIIFDPLELLTKVIPGQALNLILDALPPAASDRLKVAVNIGLLGCAYKYVIFFFGPLIVALKWGPNWYKHADPNKVTLSRIMAMQAPFDWLTVDDGVILHQKIIFSAQPDHSHHQLKFFMRDPLLKDYRNCARCGKYETHKKKRNDGKRCSSFKVCRLCKAFNFHRRFADNRYKCHYCSKKCQKRHWKEHKKIHPPTP